MEIKQLEKNFLTFKAENKIFDINCSVPCHLDGKIGRAHV